MGAPRQGSRAGEQVRVDSVSPGWPSRLALRWSLALARHVAQAVTLARANVCRCGLGLRRQDPVFGCDGRSKTRLGSGAARVY